MCKISAVDAIFRYPEGSNVFPGVCFCIVEFCIWFLECFCFRIVAGFVAGCIGAFEFYTVAKEILTFKEVVACLDNGVRGTIVVFQVLAVANLLGGLVVNVYIGTLETVDGLLGVAHHENGMVVGFQENFLENVPLQLVRVLEFVDDGVAVLFAESVAKLAFCPVFTLLEDGAVDGENHVVERLRFVFVLELLPFVEKRFYLAVKEFLDLCLENRAGQIVKLILEILEEQEGVVSFVRPRFNRFRG